MKETLTKMLVTFATIALVMSFLVTAFFVGVSAVSGAESTQDDLLLVALAIGGAAASIIKNMSRSTNAAREMSAIHITPAHGRHSNGGFMDLPSRT